MKALNKENPPSPAGFFKDAQAGGGVQVNDGAASKAVAGVVSELPAPPFPSKIGNKPNKAGGFKFELDIDRIRQSDTWAIAEPRLRPFLVMVWMESWTLLPVGSLPDSDAVIASRIGMPLIEFMGCREVLLRGWYKASDGRLYHPVITEQVLEMMRKKAGDAERKRNQRSKEIAAKPAEPSEPVAGESDASHTEVTRDSGVSPDTYHIVLSSIENDQKQDQKHLPGAEAPSCSSREQDDQNFSSVDNKPTDYPQIAIPLKDGSEYIVTGAQIAEWVPVYPDKDVVGELRRLREWNRSEPHKRKTKSGIRKHITGWLGGEPRANAPSSRRNNTDSYFEGVSEKFENYDGPTVSLL